MELYQLKSFVCVAEEGNLTRAAERLFTSQPAVSAHIKALEEGFGMKLFSRTAQGMVLTDAGEILVEEAEKILLQEKRMKARARSLQDGVCCLNLVLNRGPKALHFHTLFQQVVTEFPDIQLQVSQGKSGAITKSVLSGEIDIGFSSLPVDNTKMEAIPFAYEEMVILVPSDKEIILNNDDWKVLETMPWVYTSPQCSWRHYLEGMIQERALDLDLRYMADDDDAALHFVINGLALCLMDRFEAEPYLEDGRLKVWPHFKVSNQIQLIYLRDRRDEPTLRGFLGLVEIFLKDNAGVVPVPGVQLPLISPELQQEDQVI